MDSLVSVLPYFFQYGYVALFVLMFIGGFYLPVPSNIALVAAGALSHFSYDGFHFNIFLAALIGFAGSVLGDTCSYYIARRFGKHERRERFEKRHTSLRKIGGYLKRHPILTIGTTRLVGFLSPIVNSLSGFTKLPVRTFLLGDILGNAAYVILFMGAGYLIGVATNNVVDILAFGTGTLAVLACMYVGAIVFVQRK